MRSMVSFNQALDANDKTKSEERKKKQRVDPDKNQAAEENEN